MQWERRGVVEVDLPVKVSSIPADLDIRVDGLKVTLRGGEGGSWQSSAQDQGVLSRSPNEADSATLHTPILVDRAFFERNRDSTVKLEMTLFVTALGDPRSKVIRAYEAPAGLIGGVQCYAGAANTVACRSAFRWPAEIVEARTGAGRGHTLNSFISYSPFPAAMRLNPIETRHAPAFVAGIKPSQREVTREVTIVVKQPLAHARRDLRVDEFRLTQFAFPASLPPGDPSGKRRIATAASRHRQ